MLSRIHTRLTQQLIESGTGELEAEELAKNILVQRGHLNRDGSVTTEGYIRGNMSAEERAIDRAIKRFGGIPEHYEYDPVKNYAYKKTGKGIWRKRGKR
jgi:hypothetical protein|tara:strand:+ start:1127 stop:1423 length:297 start_codon:yes stop_codon:yes gene_type:complete